MFSELLIGMPGWSSSRCALTWKLKATKSGRGYCQLQASTPPTAGTEPSLLPTVTTTNASQGIHSKNNCGKPLLPMAAAMIPTPTAQDFKRRGPGSHQQGLPEFVRGLLPTPNAVEGTKYTRTYNPNSQMGKSLTAMALNDMLPTPEANNYKNGHRRLSPRIERKLAQGWTVGLNDLATLRLLPTPVVCLDGVYADRHPGKRHTKSIATLAFEAGGGTSQLSPLFVEQMMGFPTGWILLPFLKESLLRSEPELSTAGEPNP